MEGPRYGMARRQFLYGQALTQLQDFSYAQAAYPTARTTLMLWLGLPRTSAGNEVFSALCEDGHLRWEGEQMLFGGRVRAELYSAPATAFEIQSRTASQLTLWPAPPARLLKEDENEFPF